MPAGVPRELPPVRHVARDRRQAGRSPRGGQRVAPQGRCLRWSARIALADCPILAQAGIPKVPAIPIILVERDSARVYSRQKQGIL